MDDIFDKPKSSDTLTLSSDDSDIPDRPKIDNAPQSPALIDLVEQWLVYKSDNASKGSVLEYRRPLVMFLRVLNEYHKATRLNQLKPSYSNTYVDVLMRMPARPNQPKFEALPVKELIELDAKKLGKTARYRYAGYVKNFLGWLDNKNHLDTREHLKPFELIKKPKAKDRLKGEPFTDDDLAAIFLHPKFAKLRESMRWGMTISLCTGMRSSEVLQLRKKDIGFRDGVHYISVNEEDGKRVKNESSVGLVPISDQLVSFGFLEWVASKSDGNLFDEPMTPETDKFDDYSSRCLYYMRGNAGIKSSPGYKKVVHSFRTTVRTRLVELNIPDTLINEIVRHSNEEEGGVGRTNYTVTDNLVNKKEAIDKLVFAPLVGLVGLEPTTKGL